MDTKQLVARIKARDKRIEKGEFERAAWADQQRDVHELYAQVSSQRDVAKLIDKSPKWVRDVLRWDPTGTRVPTPFARNAAPGREASVNQAAAKKVARENPKAIAAAIKSAPAKARKAAIKVLAEDEETQSEVIEASSKAIDRKRLDPKRKPARQTKTRGALDAHGAVIKRAGSAAYQAKLCLDEVASVDEPLPADLIQSALEAIDNAQAEWELVKANLRGETVGDQAAEFLANQ